MGSGAKRKTERAPSVAFIVGEIPCAPFISAMINGVARQRSVCVIGPEHANGGTVAFASGVTVVMCPRSRLGRVRFAAKRLLKLFVRRALEPRPLWKYATKHGCNEAFGRLLYALPLVEHRPAIVHIQWAKALPRVMELRELHSFAVVLSLRGTHVSSSPLGDPLLLRKYQENFPRVHAFHAVCRAIKADAVALGASPERIRVIYSGIDADLLELPVVSLRNEMRPLRILSVGRIHWRKGYHRALDAISQVMKTHAVQYRIIAGDPNDELRLQTNDLQLQNVVDFLPSMPHGEVIEQMRRGADLLLVPSLGEGIANVAIEAMAVGLPVLATKCGGMPELIESGENGLLCDVWSIEGMADMLRHFAEMNLSQRERMRANARSFVADHRQFRDSTAQMHNVYEDAIRNQECEKRN